MFKLKNEFSAQSDKPSVAQKVSQTVVALIENGIKPTNRNIAIQCGGSFSTIAPILKKLKIQYQDFKQLDLLCRDFNIKREDKNSILKENKILKNQLENLNEYVKRLEGRALTFEGQFEKLKTEASHFKSLFESLERERKIVLSNIQEEKDKQIKMLLDELAKTHQNHSESYRTFSTKQDDRIMEKEVELINLKERQKRLELKLAQHEQGAIPQVKKLQNLEAENVALVTENERLLKKLREIADV